jgi:tRNA(Ile2)-agmatinylcytidine synthase
MLIGIDDTDSDKGMCTTYLGAVLMERLKSLGVIFGLPKLVRLNPCAQYKTRGNAAIAFEIETEKPDEVKELALQTLLELSDLAGPNTNPGLVAADEVSQNMKHFYKRAVSEILEIDDAKKILDAEDIWHRGFKNGRGLIGALAAIGAGLEEDHTYELIAYRERCRWGTRRYIDEASVWKADGLTYPMTWDTVDYHNNRIVFAPHSADPVLFGIRGDDIGAINLAFQTVISEPWERKVLYVTNQGTDAHILCSEISDVKNNQSYRLRGRVKSIPRVIEGGHLFLSIQSDGAIMACAVFEPTKNFREIIKKLAVGDLIEVYGAMKDKTLNMEKLEVLELAQQTVTQAPLCLSCGRRMKSAGRNQGYRCRECKQKSMHKEEKQGFRDLEIGFYEVPPCARRHLSKQLVRMSGKKVHISR